MRKDPINANRELWDRWTKLHAQFQSQVYDLDRFKAGETTLKEIEREELGDVAGKSLLHLQCHFGLDTLSWARRGASVTGVDFSAEAIALARSLSVELNIDAEFLCCDIYDLPEFLQKQFDIVFTSYGVLPWLPDLQSWAEVVARYLRAGGTFYMVEAHPIRRILLPRRVDDLGKPVECGYFSGRDPVKVAECGSYAVPGVGSVATAYYWSHGLGEIVTALSSAGLRLEFLHEFPKTITNCGSYVEVEPGRYELQLLVDIAIPDQFSIRAVREGTDLRT
jgi:SAM-dependent methyltransferase